MDGYSADQIREAERPHLESGEPLMLRASAGLARVVADLLDDPAERPGIGGPGSVLLLVGSGGNGGDTLYAGAALAQQGRVVEVIRAGRRIHTDALDAAVRAGVRLLDTGSEPDRIRAATRDAALRADLLLDGLLGIGSTGSLALRSPARDAVEAVRELAREQRAPFVIAVDLPSGVDADTGAVADNHVLQADITVTFGGVKAGILRGPGASLAGRIVLIDVGIGDDLAGMTPRVQTRP